MSDWFITEFNDDEALLCRRNALTEEGDPAPGVDLLYVDRARVHASSDGVFVREHRIDGELHFSEIKS